MLIRYASTFSRYQSVVDTSGQYPLINLSALSILYRPRADFKSMEACQV
jgi:hypothetical protein